MEDFIKYTEDKKFVRWVLGDDQNLDTFWEDYILNHPEEKESIQQARIIVAQFENKRPELSVPERGNLMEDIMQGIDQEKSHLKARKRRMIFTQIAAGVVILLGINFLWFSEYRSNEFERLAKQKVLPELLSIEKIQLLMASGEAITIDGTDAFIEHSQGGAIVVNHTDTVMTNRMDDGQFCQLVVPYGTNATLKLHDGSEVRINAGSQLIYPEQFNTSSRKVYLDGEGYFKVSHNPLSPFTASSSAIEIEVLGTTFNLLAYSGDSQFETSLLEGKVKVKEHGWSLFKEELVLQPLERTVFDTSSESFDSIKAIKKSYITWQEGYINFESKPLKLIVKKLERHFNVEIQLENEQLAQEKISGKLKLQDEKIETVLQVLANTVSLSVEKTDLKTFKLYKSVE